MSLNTAPDPHNTVISKKETEAIQREKFEKPTLLEEHREPKVRGFKRGVLLAAEEEKVFGLEISVHDAHGMTGMNNLNYRSQKGSRSSLGVMPLGDNPIKELSSGAELHDQVHRLLILVSAFQLHDILLACEMVHDLNFSFDVLYVFLVDQLSLGDGLARELLTGSTVSAEMGDAELAAAEFFPNGVGLADVLHWPPEDWTHGAGFGRRLARDGGRRRPISFPDRGFAGRVGFLGGLGGSSPGDVGEAVPHGGEERRNDGGDGERSRSALGPWSGTKGDSEEGGRALVFFFLLSLFL